MASDSRKVSVTSVPPVPAGMAVPMQRVRIRVITRNTAAGAIQYRSCSRK